MSVKIDIHHSQKGYDNAVERLQTLPKKNADLLREFLTDAQLGRHGGRKAVGHHKLMRYADFLRQGSEWLGNKEFVKVTDKEYTSLITNLLDDKIRKKNGEAFKQETKRGFLVALNMLFKWLQKVKKQNILVNPTAKLKEGSPEENQPDGTPRELWEKLANSGVDIMRRATIMTLLDSGARAQELLNLRIGDITEQDDKSSGKKILWIHIKHSKTLARKLSIPFATDRLKEWLQIHPDKHNQDALVFDLTYSQLLLAVSDAGMKALNKKIHPHLLRHSSATYWATRLNDSQFYYRFGWVLGSSHARRYVNRNALDMSQQANKIYAEEEGLGLAQKNKELTSQITDLTMRLSRIEKHDALLDKLFSDKRVQTIVREMVKQK